jgi:hypothetical protein
MKKRHKTAFILFCAPIIYASSSSIGLTARAPEALGCEYESGRHACRACTVLYSTVPRTSTVTGTVVPQ